MVLVDSEVYVNHIENTLKENTKFEKVYIKTMILNFQDNHEKCINEILRSLKSAGSVSNKQYKEIKTVGSRTGVLHGLCKVHKAIVDVCPPFRLILSVIGTPTYKIAKFLVPILCCLTFKNSMLKTLFCLENKLLSKTLAFT